MFKNRTTGDYLPDFLTMYLLSRSPGIVPIMVKIKIRRPYSRLRVPFTKLVIVAENEIYVTTYIDVAEATVGTNPYCNKIGFIINPTPIPKNPARNPINNAIDKSRANDLTSNVMSPVEN